MLGRTDFEQDLEDELRFHLEMQTAKHISRGMPPEAARALAEREFGGMTFTKETVRDARGLTWFDDLRTDVKYAFRTLARAPGLAVVVLTCLGLGIGANAAIFSIVNAVMLKPLPYPESDRLLNVYETYFTAGGSGQGSVSYPNYIDWRDRTRSFVSLAAYHAGSTTLRGTESSDRLSTLSVTSNYFSTMGLTPLLGRLFGGEGSEPSAEEVVVLNERLWRTRFGSDPALLGRSINLGGQERTVIGILPAFASARTQAWMPMKLSPEQATARGNHGIEVVGRMRSGVSEAEALAEIRSIAESVTREHPDQDPSRSATLRRLMDTAVGSSRPTLMILLGAVVFVLLVACANVANLLLARASSRQQEVSIRLALGASRGRLLRQFLMESLVLAIGGAVLGGAMAWFGLRALAPMVAQALPRATDLTLDARVFLYLAAVAVISALLFGLAPALQVTGGDLRNALVRGGMRGSSGVQSRLRATLVVAELALSLVLLVGAGLLLRGVLMLQGTPTGFSSGNVLTAHLSIPDTTGSGPGHFTGSFLDAVGALPGVSAAGMISRLPIQSYGTNANYTISGRPRPEQGREPLAEVRFTTPGLFKALSIPVLAGRDFLMRDLVDSGRVTVINKTMAEREFRGVDPIGQRITLGGNREYTIIGVVGDVRQVGLDRDVLPEMHLPARATDDALDMTLVVRATSNPLALVPAVRGLLRAADPGQALFREMTMDDVIATSLTSRRLNLWLFGVFAVVALVLSVTGLYGVLAYLVSQRTREIGIRIALGARPQDVVVMVVKEGGVLVSIGLGIGLLGALALTRVLASMLYGVSPRDPLTLMVVTVVLGGAALIACLIPARRAARIAPVLAMRAE
ncbi:MAG: ABC transporter permease [Gemmatimonadales bacterium]|nr:ABC transporter permease [Gemmatimonadales bacterium]